MARLALAWGLLLLFGTGAKAGDLIDRLKQYATQSSCFDLPSVVHFDLNTLEEDKLTPSITQVRYLGRQVNGGGGRKRIDFVKVTATGRGETRVLEHYLELAVKEKYYAFRLSGNSLQKVSTEDSTHATLTNVNPFHFALAGGLELYRTVGSPVEGLISRFDDFPNSNRFIRNTGATARSAWLLRFDSDVPWQVVRSKAFRSTDNCEPSDLKWSAVKEVDVEKNWHVSIDLNSKWSEVEGERVPIYVHSLAQFYDCNDPSKTEEFEGLFFDIEFDPVDIERYFNKERLSKEFVDQDFSADKLEKQSNVARRFVD
jgi:hypothetical protein